MARLIAQLGSEQWTSPNVCPNSCRTSFTVRSRSRSLLRGKPIELLMQPAQRNHGDGPIELRLPKQETEHRNCQVHIRDSQNPRSVVRSCLRQHLHDLHRLVLPSLRVISAFRNRQRRQAPNGQRKPLGRSAFDPLQCVPRNLADRHEIKSVHTACTCTSLDSRSVISRLERERDRKCRTLIALARQPRLLLHEPSRCRTARPGPGRLPCLRLSS